MQIPENINKIKGIIIFNKKTDTNYFACKLLTKFDLSTKVVNNGQKW